MLRSSAGIWIQRDHTLLSVTATFMQLAVQNEISTVHIENSYISINKWSRSYLSIEYAITHQPMRTWESILHIQLCHQTPRSIVIRTRILSVSVDLILLGTIPVFTNDISVIRYLPHILVA